MNERKPPELGRFEDLASRDRIPTLTEIAIPPREPTRSTGSAEEMPGPGQAGGTGSDRPVPEPGGLPHRYEWTPAANVHASGEPAQNPGLLPAHGQPDPRPAYGLVEPGIDESDIEEITDRVLDALAPILREHIALALAQLLDERLGRSR